MSIGRIGDKGPGVPPRAGCPLAPDPRAKNVKGSKHSQLEGTLYRLYGYAFSLCGDREDARDLVQEAAAKALGARQVPRDQSAYRAWLFKILRNSFFDSLRRRERRRAYEAFESQNLNNLEYWDYDDRLIDVMTVKLELARLHAAQREIIGLIDICGFSYAEAAETLEIPVGTVMSRISRARGALLAALGDSNVRPLRMKRSK